MPSTETWTSWTETCPFVASCRGTQLAEEERGVGEATLWATKTSIPLVVWEDISEATVAAISEGIEEAK